jgi:hypothetical protein
LGRLSTLAFAALAGSVLVLGHETYAVAAQQKQVVKPGHSTTYEYDTPGIQLEGTLIERKVFGPPGYGETPSRDARDTILILSLSNLISVAPTTNSEANGSVNLDPAKDVREVQLFVDRSQLASVRKLAGRVIKATGTLNESITASQYTKVWLDVKAFMPK